MDIELQLITRAASLSMQVNRRIQVMHANEHTSLKSVINDVITSSREVPATAAGSDVQLGVFSCGPVFSWTPLRRELVFIRFAQTDKNVLIPDVAPDFLNRYTHTKMGFNVIFKRKILPALPQNPPVLVASSTGVI